ncbi:hypothetical protein Golomagni_07953, partial [Golovinomyces magnicellulatus]
TLRRFRKVAKFGRPSISSHCFLHCWRHAILYLSSTRRTSSHLPTRRILFFLGYPISRSIMGLCHGLELCDAMAISPTARNHCCVRNNRILERSTTPSHLHHHLPLHHCHDQHVWHQRLRRSRIHLFHYQSHRRNRLHASPLFSSYLLSTNHSLRLLGIVLNCGGTPDRGYIGGEYWRNPGAFHNGFKGLCSVFVTAAFAFTGTELVGLAAAETANPRKSLPTAIKQVFWRITLFYIVALTLVGLLVPYTDPRLLGDNESTVDIAASPFVIAIEEAGIEILPSVMNAVILVAVLSVGNSAVFGSSRTLAALANLNQAPKILGYVDRKGRPLVAIIVASAVGLLAYLADVKHQSTVLD